MRKLKNLGIETRPAWKPMHMQPLCNSFEFVPHSSKEVISSDLFFQCLCLPSGSAMTFQDIDRITEELLKLLR